MEYYNNTLCVEAGSLYNNGIVSKTNYDALVRRQYLQVLRRACKGTPALIAYDSIPTRFKKIIVEKFGDPYKTVKHNQFKDHIQPDPKAQEFYQAYLKPDNSHLPDASIRKYCANAQILNAIHEVYSNRKAMRKALGGSAHNIWEKLSDAVNSLDTVEYPHNLPNNFRRLHEKYNDYRRQGYAALVHKGECNQNSRKVTKKMERLFLCLYAMPTRPFTTSVRDMYLQFLSGTIDVADVKTGEMFERTDFYDKNGEPVGISESTTWRYIKTPSNQLLLDKIRKSSFDFNNNSIPFNHRHNAEFSLSKVSFDDRDLPRKMLDGNYAKCYYAYEPMSGCFIGASYSRDTKDINLIMECFRDMYQTFLKYDLPWPAEGEVERHLMSSITDSLHSMFAHVRMCNPRNPREKRAEQGIKSKKYGVEKDKQPNIGRWSNRSDAYQINQDNDKRYSFEQLVADDKQANWDHNHEEHPNYKGKTRWQVLCEYVNPNLAKPQKRIILRHIGHCTETSIRNNDFVRVQYADYAIESLNILSRLQPNNYTVNAYWLAGEDGNISEVFLYQGETFLGRASKYETYNEAIAERTEHDEEIRTEQAKRQAHVRKVVKDGVANIPKVSIIDNKTDYSDIKTEVITEPVPVNNDNDYDTMLNGYDEEYTKARALDSL